MNSIRCGICPHECLIPEGKNGICTVRTNSNGKILSEAYGKITALALDPVEKKPLRMFYQGTMILSVGSYGCNFHCGFCQNHEIAMPEGAVTTNQITPQQLVKMAQETVPQGNIGIAYTYNEPLINYEFVYDCARVIHEAGLKNVLVTNGFINEEPLKNLLPYIDAMNIDLKSFSDEFYRKIGGRLESVKRTIETAHKHCHTEVTTLVIPDENEDDIEPLAKWLSGISDEIPLHISRFFPRSKYSNREPTSTETVFKLKETAGKYLKNVF
jgi:pyruvate formate lyase activating enzyme